MSAAAPLPDAAPANWVDRFAPSALRPWLRLGRFDRPAGTWLLLLPGWQALALGPARHGGWPDLRLLVLFAIGAAVMRAAGCAYNDIVDRDLDAKVERTAKRPIPSGQIGVKGAWADEWPSSSVCDARRTTSCSASPSPNVWACVPELSG